MKHKSDSGASTSLFFCKILAQNFVNTNNICNFTNEKLTQNQRAMKELNKISKREKVEATIGLACVWGAILLSVFMIKIFA